MNCKPGDLAVIVAFLATMPRLTGKIVDVIEAVPVGVWFTLPDGKAHQPCEAACWVVRFHQPIDLSEVRGKPTGLFAVCPDYALRPIRDPGEEAVDEMIQLLPAPSAETADA